MSNWPQVVVLGAYVGALVANIANREGVAQTLVYPLIGLGVLYAGGFFACWGIAP